MGIYELVIYELRRNPALVDAYEHGYETKCVQFIVEKNVADKPDNDSPRVAETNAQFE